MKFASYSTSAVVIGVLLPLGVLIRQLASDRATAAAEQDARQESPPQVANP